MKLVLVMAVSMLFFAACESSRRDGDGDPMIWKADVAVQFSHGVYNVAADGATLVFSCRNYSAPWFSSANEITVTGGDIFYTFKFEQCGNNEE